MLMCRSPFQGLLFIYTSQSQPPRCQPGLWHGTHSQGEGAEQRGGGEQKATLANKVERGEMAACSAFVKGSGGETLLTTETPARSVCRLPPMQTSDVILYS